MDHGQGLVLVVEVGIIAGVQLVGFLMGLRRP